MNIGAIGPVAAGLISEVSGKAAPLSAGIGDFGSFLGDIGSEALGNIHHAEQQSLAALEGRGSVHEVAEAVMSAEQSLQVAVSIRDKIVSAYLEISRMAI